MSYQSEDLIARIRSARVNGRISQRELSRRTGLTQSNISLIESGAVDPGVSSVINLARALDLELVLVPRKLVPAVAGVVQAQTREDLSPESGTVAMQTLRRGGRAVAKLQELHRNSKDLDRLAEMFEELRSLPLNMRDLLMIRNVVDALKHDRDDAPFGLVAKRLASELASVRNALVHGRSDAPRPAYGTEEDEGGDDA